MAKWLHIEESPIDKSIFVAGAARAGRSKQGYVLTLRKVLVLNNKKLFGGAEVHAHTVVIDGYPDMKSKTPFWALSIMSPNVKDGDPMSIDSELGLQLYRGKPDDFLNLYIMVVRSKKAARDFAKVLKENMIGQGIGTLVGGAVSIFAKLPTRLGPDAIRDLATGAVNTTIDYFIEQKDPVIGVYYGSLTREKKYGLGFHPAGYPDDLLSCGEALQLGYHVEKSGE